MRAHIIENGIVVNTIIVDSLDFDAGPGKAVIDGSTGGIGWTYADGALLPPDEGEIPVVVPQAVSRYQALAALMQAGLLDAVRAWADDPATDPLHKLAFDTATEFARSSPTLAAGAGALGWTGDQLDDLFIAAAEIIA